MPLHNIIIEIDNGNTLAKVLKDHAFTNDQNYNLETVAKILNI